MRKINIINWQVLFCPSVWKFWSFWFSLTPREWCETLDNVLWLPKRSSAWVSWFLVCIFNPVACSRMLAERIWSPSTSFDAWQRQGWVKPGCLISWQIFGSCFIINHWFSSKLPSSERFRWWMKWFRAKLWLLSTGNPFTGKHLLHQWDDGFSWVYQTIFILSLSLYCHILSYFYVLRRRTPLLWQPVMAPLGGPPPKSISCMYELYGCTVMQCTVMVLLPTTTAHYHYLLLTVHRGWGIPWVGGGSGVSNTTVSHINT